MMMEISTMPEGVDASSFIEALSNRHWPLLISLILMFVIWAFRNFINANKNFIPTKYIPIITLATCVLFNSSSRIFQSVQNSLPWWYGLIQGLIEGLTISTSSMGLWSVGGKKLPLKNSVKGNQYVG